MAGHPETFKSSVSDTPKVNSQSWKRYVFLMMVAIGVMLISHWWHRPASPPESIIQYIPEGPLSGPARLVFGKKIPLNQASQEDFLALPGIGPGRAKRIFQWRQQHGLFLQNQDLQEVPGIGHKTYRRLAPYLSASP